MKHGCDILINRNSGTVLNETEEKVRARLVQALPGYHSLHFLTAAEIERWLHESMSDTPVLIGGGDGTITHAAGILMEKERAFGVLPLGTMNLFARDLGLTENYYETALLYADSIIREIDVAEVNGHIFLCNAIVGIAADMVRHREDTRKQRGLLKWTEFMRNLINKLGTDRDRYFLLRHDDARDTIRAKALVISNNNYAPATIFTRNQLKKDSLVRGRLGVYIVSPDDRIEGLRLIGRVALGVWQADPAVDHFETGNMLVTTRHKETDITLDGEVIRLKSPLEFKVRPRALKILVPCIQDGNERKDMLEQ